MQVSFVRMYLRVYKGSLAPLKSTFSAFLSRLIILKWLTPVFFPLIRSLPGDPTLLRSDAAFLGGQECQGRWRTHLVDMLMVNVNVSLFLRLLIIVTLNSSGKLLYVSSF